MTTLALNKIKKSFGNLDIIRGVDLAIGSGEFVVFVGPSGCGKSTLLRMIAGLEPISGGELSIGGERMNERAASERGIAMVFQSYALYPHMSVRQNLAFGVENARMPRAEIDERIAEAARMLEIAPYLDRRLGQLSGGQRQRVAIGRAVVKEPAIFLFDEPLSNLDAALRGRTRLELAQLHRRLGATMVFVTHDQIEAMTLATRIVVMNAGRIEQVAPPAELYRRPATRFVAGFIGTPGMNFIPVRRLADRQGRAVVELPGGQEIGTLVEAAVPGSELTLGIRPEHLVTAARGPLPAQVEMVEFLGERTLAHVRLVDGTRAIATVAGVSPAAGETVQLDLAMDEAHLFDKQGLAHHASAQGAVA